MENETRNDPAPAPKRPAYDPPQVERVMNADEIAREVHYAGSIGISPNGPPG
jgi:hypothetical protein